MDHVTAAATTVMELLGFALIVAAVGVAAGHRYGLPGGLAAAGLALLLLSGVLAATRTPRPVVAAPAEEDTAP